MTLPTETPRNIDRCARCGYLLTGLPDAGRCPECGQEYGQSVIVLYGWGGINGEYSQFGKRGWLFWLGIVTPAVFISIYILSGMGSGYRGSPFAVWLFPFPLIAAAAAILVAHGNADIPPVLMIIHERGWTWGYHALAKERLFLHRICVIGIYGPMYFLWFSQSVAALIVFLVVYGASFAGSLLWQWMRRWRQRRPAAAPPDAAVPGLQPWSIVDRVRFAKIAPETWRIALITKGELRSFRLGPRRQGFSMDCQLSDARMAHIRAQVSAWPIGSRIDRT